MTRFLPVLLTLAACLAVVSAADAQTPPTTPTVSSVAVTSNPGTDGVYDTLDVITVTVTFSEAVAVTGDPMISLQIGGRKREADYAGAGAGTGELLFNYTVHPRDQDDDGIAVVEDGLEANGGAIRSADDATAATLTHTGATFAGHKVDTELILLSNMGQADGTPLRINAGERIRIATYVWESNVIYRPDEIALDIKTPSDTLDLTLILEHRLVSPGAYRTHTFTGSVSTAGKQTFAAPSFGFLPLLTGIPTLYISASGTGFVELGTTASLDEDDPHAYRWNIADKVYRSTGEGSFQELRSAHLPRFTISGHTTETLRILEADIVSEPYDGAAYAAGEHIEVRIILNGSVRPLATPLTVPLYLGPGAEHRRDARLVTIRGNYRDVLTPQDRQYVLYFAYTVQPGDTDTDGIVLGANPLGQAADRRIEYAMDPRVKMDLAFPAREPGASQRVDGSQASSCDAVHCAIVTAAEGRTTESSTDSSSIDSGYFGLADLFDAEDREGNREGNMSGRLFIYDGQEYFFVQVSVDADVLDDGTLSSRPDFWFTQPLQSQAVDRLGIELEGRAFALADILAYRFTKPTREEHGFEHYEGYGWSTTGLVWRPGERQLFKIVEMPVTASYDASKYETDEGDTLEVTVTLEGSFELETVTLPLVATGNAGATDADYLGVPAELVFAPGETEKQFTITIVQDDLDDDDETVTLSFGTLPDTVKTGGEHETATITIQDDDDPEITVAFEHDSYDIAEGGSATVKVTLSADPERDITIPVTTTLMGGASAADYAGVPAELAFATGETEQTFTVMATQDEVDDDDERVMLGFGKLPNRVTEDPNPKSSVNITDDDTAALVLSETALTVDEGDAAGRTYTVKLGTEPTADVTVTVTGHADTDLTLGGLSATNTLTFTTSNWNTAQTVTVKAAQDADAANDTVTLTHSAAGAEYDDLTASLDVTVDDDETAAIVLSKSALSVDEGDASGESYTIKLSHVPTASVTVTVSGHASSDVSLDKTSLTFTTSNWNSAQTVTVKAAQDADAADDTVTLTHTAAGAEYDDLTASLEVTVDDDETAAIVLSKSLLSVDEGDTTGESYTVKLSHVPTASVTVTVSGHAASDVSVDDTSLTFTTSNWNSAQTVTVKAAEDADAADDTVTLTHTAAGAEYDDLTASLVVTVGDDDTAGVTIMPTAITVLGGGSNSYAVALTSEPAGAVTVTASGHTGSDLSLDQTVLTFTTSNWNTAQTITVSAAAAASAASVSLAHAVASTADSVYDALSGATVSVTVVPTGPSIQVVQLGVTTSRQELTVREGGSDTYSVVLSHVPTADVTLTITDPSDNTEASASPDSLTFTTSNWNTAQTVTVSAAEDDDAVADRVATVTHSLSGGGYDDVTVPDVEVTIVENDSPSIVLSANALSVGEGNTSGETYTVELATQPSASVTVTVSGHAGSDVSLDKTSLTFTTSNWNTAQTVTVKAAGDADAADDVVTLTHTGTGGDYAGLTAALEVTVDDDETAAIVLSASSLAVDEGDTSGETYTVKLSHVPTASVTVTVSGHASSDVSLDKTSLAFTTSNWNTAQTVTVTAAEDADAADDPVTLTHTAAGAEYDDLTASLEVTVDDDETAAIVLSKSALSVGEGDASGESYTVKLSHVPTASVTVTVSGHAGSDVSLDKSSLTFTTSNWNSAQTVTVKAAQDADAAADTVSLTHTAAGAEYDDLTASLEVTVDDDETAGVTITPTALTVLGGGSNSYAVTLTSEPAGDVTVTASGHAGSDLSLDQTVLTFTTSNWNTAQTITVSAADAAAAASVSLAHAVASTADSVYDALSGATVSVTVVPTGPSIQVVQLGVTTSRQELRVPEGGSNSYSVVLSHAPSGAVTLTITDPSDNTEASASPDSLTFTTSNWNSARTVTVSAAEDDDAIADRVATVTHSLSGGGYDDVTRSPTSRSPSSRTTRPRSCSPRTRCPSARATRRVRATPSSSPPSPRPR